MRQLGVGTLLQSYSGPSIVWKVENGKMENVCSAAGVSGGNELGDA